MKKLTLFIVFLLVTVGFLPAKAISQSPFFDSVRPEAAVVVRKHSMGADLVDITISAKGDWGTVLRDDILALGMALGSEPRGIQISGGESLYKASFAINGLINDSEPRLNTKALAFGKMPIRSFSVFFEGVIPSSSIPARWFAPKDAWMLEGIGLKSPRGIDYRIKVNSNNPDDITLPGSVQSRNRKESPQVEKKLDFLLIGAILIASVSVGLLVYSALIRSRSRR
jgi:hypothetical protein